VTLQMTFSSLSGLKWNVFRGLILIVDRQLLANC
jgi:hypothetical protein